MFREVESVLGEDFVFRNWEGRSEEEERFDMIKTKNEGWTISVRYKHDIMPTVSKDELVK